GPHPSLEISSTSLRVNAITYLAFGPGPCLYLRPTAHLSRSERFCSRGRCFGCAFTTSPSRLSESLLNQHASASWPLLDDLGEPDGAHARIRTGDLLLTKEMLCHLSYVGGAPTDFICYILNARFMPTIADLLEAARS